MFLNHDDVNALPDDGVNPLEILDADLTLALEDLVDEVAPRRGADVPLLDIADALRMLQPRARNEGNVAERRPSEVSEHGFVGFGPQSFRLATQIRQILVGDGNKLLDVIHTIDSRLYISSDVTFSLDFTIVVVNNLIQILEANTGTSKKCLILDLDNTLWGGIIGDDGLENIQIGDLGIGKAFTEIQLWAKALKERGIILAVCSKNDEANAREPFEKHPEMVLRTDDIAVFVANWSNKHDNIKYIQSVLNIGFDSMVFLDDNPFENETWLEPICPM